MNGKEDQLRFFKTQLSIALEHERTATIHCVRAHGEMLKILKTLNKEIKKKSSPLVMHSYGGST